MGVLGLNYGLQASQFTATSTTAECQTLSNPMYVHSIPNNNDNQDIVSMGTNSALMAKTVIENAYQVMAILMMGIVQAIDCLDIADRISPRSQQVYKEIRAFFPVFREDTPKYKEIESMMVYLKKGGFKKNEIRISNRRKPGNRTSHLSETGRNGISYTDKLPKQQYGS